MFKRTKIIATVGPACASVERLAALIRAGVDCFRLNLSHGDHAGHLASLQMIRAAAASLSRSVGVLADLQGPKIRTGRLKGDQPVEWVTGNRVVITMAPFPEGTAERVESTYKDLVKDVKPNDHILVDDGKMRLRVEAVTADEVHCLIEVGGKLKNNKGLNLPGVRVSAPALSPKDLRDLAWACANQVDFIALSFVHTAADCYDLRQRMTALGSNAGIIAKVELPEAVEDIAAIAQESDGVMVARGDLGIEISPEWLPMVQKDLIRSTNQQGRIVITATQMLESMIDCPMPTRAETTDIANAIFDGTDVIMLSGETASGKYPQESVEAMARIALVAEGSPYLRQVDEALDRSVCFPRELLALTKAAHVLAEERRVAAIVVVDHDPLLIRLLSERRGQTPVVVACRDDAQARRLILYWGVVPLLGEGDALVEQVIARGLAQGMLSPGDELVVLSRTPCDQLSIRAVPKG